MEFVVRNVPGLCDGGIIGGVGVRDGDGLVVRRTLSESSNEPIFTVLEPGKPISFTVKRKPTILDSELGASWLGCSRGQSQSADTSDCWSDSCQAIPNWQIRGNETACGSNSGGLQD